jgi:Na+/melibiose symporter-like transporter
VFQAVIIALIVLLTRRLHDPLPADPSRPFDVGGAVLSALGLILLVLGILAADNSGWLALGLIIAGALVLLWFFRWIRHEERTGKEPLIATSLFRNRTSNLGLVTQNVQWLILLGTSFTVSAYLQVVRGYDAIQTGVIFTATTVGLLLSSLAAERFARRRAQRTLIVIGFVVTMVGIGVLIALAGTKDSPWAFAPGLFLIGFGLGGMLTPSVNVVQSSFPDKDQGDISGLSRSVSNLGSSFGTALVGSALVAAKLPAGKPFAVALTMMLVFTLIGLVLGVLIPRKPIEATAAADPDGRDGLVDTTETGPPG